MTEGSQGLSGTAARLGIPVGVGHGGLGDRVASEARHPAQVAVADTGPGARGQGPCEQARVAGAWEARAAPTDQEGVLPNGRGVLGGADADGDGAQRRRPQRGRQGGAARARRRPNGRNEGARPPRCPGRAGRSHATAASAAVGALAPAIRVQQDAGRLPPAPAAVRSFLARRARAQVHVSREMLRMRPYVQDRGTGSVIHLMRGGLEERRHPTTRRPSAALLCRARTRNAAASPAPGVYCLARVPTRRSLPFTVGARPHRWWSPSRSIPASACTTPVLAPPAAAPRSTPAHKGARGRGRWRLEGVLRRGNAPAAGHARDCDETAHQPHAVPTACAALGRRLAGHATGAWGRATRGSFSKP
jgi:hypothetical protein